MPGPAPLTPAHLSSLALGLASTDEPVAALVADLRSFLGPDAALLERAQEHLRHRSCAGGEELRRRAQRLLACAGHPAGSSGGPELESAGSSSLRAVRPGRGH